MTPIYQHVHCDGCGEDEMIDISDESADIWGEWDREHRESCFQGNSA